MKLNDLLFTPIFIVIIYVIAYLVRPTLCDKITYKYFIPALSFKLVAAIAVGLIYQYLYGYGDTLRYHFFSMPIHNQLLNNPTVGLKILFSEFNTSDSSIAYYLNDNYFFRRGADGFLMIKICSVLGLISMHSYYAIAVLLAFLSFFGVWALYNVFYRIFPELHKEFFFTFFCIPSVVFWGSGILKDTITLSALGWLIYALYFVFIRKEIKLKYMLIIALTVYLLIVLKLYILLCFIPGALLWIFSSFIGEIRNYLVRIMISPMILLFFIGSGYFLIENISLYDARYSVQNLEKTMSVTADWITYSSGVSGSVYSLGDDFDLSLTGIIRKLPAGINVTLFRPYLWEVNNVVMLLASVESLLLFVLTIYVLFKVRLGIFFKIIANNALVKFLLFFSLSFAFAVGISTYNFGSLVRYKIPCIPFYVALLFIVLHLSKKSKDSRDTSEVF